MSDRSVLVPGFARVFGPPEGAERRRRWVAWAPHGACVPCDRHARRFRRSTCGVSPLGPLFRETGQTSFHFASIQAGDPAPPFIRATSSHLRQPRLATARAVIRDDPELCAACTQNPGATPCSANGPPPEGALSEQGGVTICEKRESASLTLLFARSVNIVAAASNRRPRNGPEVQRSRV